MKSNINIFIFFLITLALSSCKLNDLNIKSTIATNTTVATLYFYNDGTQSNAMWNNVGNWWSNSAHTKTSTRLPSNGDSIYLIGTIAPTSGPISQLKLSLFDSSGLVPSDGRGLDFLSGVVTGYIQIKTGGSLIIGVAGDTSGTNIHKWYGSVEDLTVTSLIQGYSYVYGSVGNATLNDSSQNVGNILGDAVFNSAWNSYDDSTSGPFGVVHGNAIFNGMAGILTNAGGNNGIVMGNAIFLLNACNGYDAKGEVFGTATFNNTSANFAGLYVPGTYIITNAIFNDTSKNSGTVSGNAIFNNNSNNFGNSGIFGTVIGSASFYGASANSTLNGGDGNPITGIVNGVKDCSNTSGLCP